MTDIDQRINAIISSNRRPVFGHGISGACGVFDYLSSPQNLKRLAAETLWMARQNAAINRMTGRNHRQATAEKLEAVAAYRRRLAA